MNINQNANIDLKERPKFKPGDVVRVKNNPGNGPWTVKSVVPMAYNGCFENYLVLIVKEGGRQGTRLVQELLILDNEPPGLSASEETTDDEEEEGKEEKDKDKDLNRMNEPFLVSATSRSQKPEVKAEVEAIRSKSQKTEEKAEARRRKSRKKAKEEFSKFLQHSYYKNDIADLTQTESEDSDEEEVVRRSPRAQLADLDDIMQGNYVLDSDEDFQDSSRDFVIPIDRSTMGPQMALLKDIKSDICSSSSSFVSAVKEETEQGGEVLPETHGVGVSFGTDGAVDRQASQVTARQAPRVVSTVEDVATTDKSADWDSIMPAPMEDDENKRKSSEEEIVVNEPSVDTRIVIDEKDGKVYGSFVFHGKSSMMEVHNVDGKISSKMSSSGGLMSEEEDVGLASPKVVNSAQSDENFDDTCSADTSLLPGRLVHPDPVLQVHHTPRGLHAVPPGCPEPLGPRHAVPCHPLSPLGSSSHCSAEYQQYQPIESQFLGGYQVLAEEAAGNEVPHKIPLGPCGDVSNGESSGSLLVLSGLDCSGDVEKSNKTVQGAPGLEPLNGSEFGTDSIDKVKPSRSLKLSRKYRKDKHQIKYPSSVKVKVEKSPGIRRLLPGGVAIFPESTARGVTDTADQVDVENFPSQDVSDVVDSTEIPDLGDLDGIDLNLIDEGVLQLPRNVWNTDLESFLVEQVIKCEVISAGAPEETNTTENTRDETMEVIEAAREWLEELDVDVDCANTPAEEIGLTMKKWSTFNKKKSEIESWQDEGVSPQYQFHIENLLELCENLESQFVTKLKELQTVHDHFSSFGKTHVDNVVEDGQFQPRYFTDDEIKAIHQQSDGPVVTKKKEQILGQFKEFLAKCGEKRSILEMPFKDLSRALGTFLYTLTKVNGQHHEPSTLTTLFSRLNSTMTTLLGGINPLTHLDFETYKLLRKAKLRLAKSQPGNGMRKHQADMLYPEEVQYLFFIGVFSPSTPWGIIRILYFFLVGVCNNRAITDNNELRMGDIHIQYDPAGCVEYAEVRLQKSKSDQGDRLQVPVKRPRITPLEDKSRDFFSAFFRLKVEMEKLGQGFLEPTARIFLEPRCTGDYVASGNHCLFKPKYLSPAAISHIVKNAAIEGNLNLEGRKICNTSMRVNAFKNQIDTGISGEQAMALDGHLSERTRRHYDRGNTDNLDVYGGALTSVLTGSTAILPRSAGLRLTDHLQKPFTVKSQELDTTPSTINMKRNDKAAEMAAGREAKSIAIMTPVFNEEPMESMLNLETAYNAHRKQGSNPFASGIVYGDEEEFSQMIGIGLVEGDQRPELPKPGEHDGVALLPRKPLTVDGEPVGSTSKVWREPAILQDISNRQKKRPASPTISNGRSKKKTPPKPKTKASPASVDDVIFARTPETPVSWPGRVLKVFSNPKGDVSGYRVELFGHKKIEDVNKTKVTPLNNETVKRFGHPALNRKKKIHKELFPGALSEAIQIAESKGMAISPLEYSVDQENLEGDDEDVPIGEGFVEDEVAGS